MKGDFTRLTFHPEKHFASVRMQQGRVQMDADWNEQVEIARHRDETAAADIMGQVAAPIEGGGFRLDATANNADLTVSAGRLYLNGQLCENDSPLTYSQHVNLTTGDFPNQTGVTQILTKAAASVGIVYLDVWPQHITPIEDASIREVALGGPDTATRIKTLWQIKTLPLPGVAAPQANALQALVATRESTALALVAAESAKDAVNAAKLTLTLNRIDGSIAPLLASGSVFCGVPNTSWNTVVAPSSGSLTARIAPSGQATNVCELVPRTGYQRLDNQLYRVEIHTVDNAGNATFKWSRENGSVVVPWIGQDVLNLKVGSTGRGAPLGFSSGDWIELMDDTHELLGQPGMMLQVAKVDDNLLVVNPPVSGTIQFTDYPRNPRIRRWDQPAASIPVSVPATNDGFLPVEANIEVKFTLGTLRPGDYWLIPARTAGSATEVGSIEWPVDSVGTPLPQHPAGIMHQYGRLALVWLDPAQKLHVIADCRRVFPAVTNLRQLFHVGGGGDGLPGQPLPQPLLAGVSNGGDPAAGALVQFHVIDGGGSLAADSGTGTTVLAVTDENGIASCNWTLGNLGLQQVEARLLDAALTPHHIPARYFATFTAPTSQVRVQDFRIGQNLPLRNGSYVIPLDLIAGLRILCSAPVDARSLVSSLTCAVTLHLPWPLPQENFLDISVFAAYRPLILVGSLSVDKANPSTILWVPTTNAAFFLSAIFSRIGTIPGAQALPMRLTLDGNFVLSSKFSTSLDADTFLGPAGLQFPTGDGQAGGKADFWFVLVPVRPPYNVVRQVRLDALAPTISGIGTDQL